MKLNRLILVTSTLLFFFIPVNSFAVHKGAGGLVCGQCHTMHNSQGRQALNTNSNTDDTAMILLRGNVTQRSEIHKLCLQCHATNGQFATENFPPRNVQAPKVYSDAPWNHLTDSFNKIGSAGNFFNELTSSWDPLPGNAVGRGHSIGSTTAIPPGADSNTEISLTCTNCHDPHGTDNPDDPNINIFRNLKVKAFESGDDLNGGLGIKLPTRGPEYFKTKSYVGGISVGSARGAYFGGSDTDNGGNTVWPIFTERYGALTGNPVTDNGKTNSYGTGNDENLGNATISKWCAQCHDKWHEAYVPDNQIHTGAPAGFGYLYQLDAKRHPVNSMVPRASKKATEADPDGCANNCHHSLLDRTNYNTSLIIQGKGIPVTGSNFFDSGNSNVYYLPECNTAGNPACSEMDHLDSGINHKVFCFTCHFAHGGPNYDLLRWNYNSDVTVGNQMGNAIESNVGCQLCHNR